MVQREAGAPALAKGWAVGGDREAAHGHATWKERTEGLARSCKCTHEESKTVQGPQKPAGVYKRGCVRTIRRNGCEYVGHSGTQAGAGHRGRRDKRAQTHRAFRVRPSSACAGAPAAGPVGHDGLRPHSAWHAVPKVFAWGFSW